MPVYDYVCRDCGQVVEVIHSVAAAGPERCTNCGGSMRKAMSAPTVVFKGSGWAKKERAAAAGKGSESKGADDAPKAAEAPKADAPKAGEKKSSSEQSTAS